ncbi:MAG: Smr/MutS family protein [Bdellovibrionota bacterium]|mgnify:CR=1 FL=1
MILNIGVDTELNKKSAVLLEWESLLALAEKEARSAGAKFLIRQQSNPKLWAKSIDEARLMQQETSETMALLNREAMWKPLNNLPDISSGIKRMEHGEILNETELAAIRCWLYAIDSWTNITTNISTENLRGELIKKAILALPYVFEPIQILEKIPEHATPSDLSNASKSLQPFAMDINSGIKVLTYWDAAQSRARAGLRYSGKSIAITADRKFMLKQSAHPLLWQTLADNLSPVRNDIEFGEPSNALIITGPNAGGKTVLLKTLGLAGICARTGFPFPATDQPIIPFFDSILVELQILNFSSYVLSLKNILDQATSNSLVLIDTLNIATDPDEGAAICRAFLEAIITKGALIVCTTHDPQLKILSTTNQAITTASMAFDEKSNLPSFKLITGIPGSSQTLKTAKRLGLQQNVLDSASGYISNKHQDFENMLSKFESNLRESAITHREAIKLREEAERMHNEWSEKTSQSVDGLLSKVRQKLKRITEQAQDEITAHMKQLNTMKTQRNLADGKTRVHKILQESLKNVEKSPLEEAPDLAEALPQQTKPHEIQAGQTVRIGKWKTSGTVIKLLDGKAQLSVGSLQVVLPFNEIEPLLESKQKSKGSITIEKSSTTQPTELDIRGLRYDDAMAAAEKYLDRASRSDTLTQVTIIHGLGTGALREGLRKLLEGLPYVKSSRDAGYGSGGAGATIVELTAC